MPSRSAEALENEAVSEVTKSFPIIDEEQAKRLYRSASLGGEIESAGTIAKWIHGRLSFGMVELDSDDYTKALIHGIRMAKQFVGADYGTARVRDLGQKWTDSARGFLGELAFAKFIQQHYKVRTALDYSLGARQEYLPSDIKEIKLPDGRIIKPSLKLSIKATKFNGLWLDLPGAQVDHSDVFVSVKIGVNENHFVAFLKMISLFRDKLIPKGVESGAIDEGQAQELWDSLPDFKSIPCYVAGFLDEELLTAPPYAKYKIQHTRDGKFKRYMIGRYLGWVRHGKAEALPEDVDQTKFAFELIENFSKTPHFVVNIGWLKHGPSDWQNLISNLVGGLL